MMNEKSAKRMAAMMRKKGYNVRAVLREDGWWYIQNK